MCSASDEWLNERCLYFRVEYVVYNIIFIYIFCGCVKCNALKKGTNSPVSAGKENLSLLYLMSDGCFRKCCSMFIRLFFDETGNYLQIYTIHPVNEIRSIYKAFDSKVLRHFFFIFKHKLFRPIMSISMLWNTLKIFIYILTQNKKN